MEPIRISYRSSGDEYTYNLLLGIAVQRKRLQAQDRPACLLTHIVRGNIIRGAVLLLLFGLLVFLRIRKGELWHLYYLLPVATAFVSFFFYYAVGAMGQYKQGLKASGISGLGGELLFDEEGLTDYSADGQITRKLWSQLDVCIITDVLIVFFFGNLMIYVGNDRQTERGVRAAMEQLEKSDCICCRSIKGAADPNKIF